jgi:hypothetical protein
MLSALPALLVLIGFPHFGLKPSRPVSPADSLPPAWRTASRLALEDRFVLGTLRPVRLRGAGLLLRLDPRTLRVAVAPDSGLLSTSAFVGDVPLEPGAARSLSVFSRESARLAFERQWRTRSLRDINTRPGAATGAPTTGLSFKLPSPLPARVQSWLGPGGPALNVAGSENIRLSGTSDWTNRQTGLLGQRRSLFPTLNMQQDLDIRLEGQLSDRIKVNLLQNSANQIPLANRIAINYKGDEDDLVQAFDLGNTNLTLPGTQYVSYSGRNEGLFGVKTTLRYGALDLTVLASKQEGKSERASYSGGASATSQTLADFDYVRGIYFLLYDPSGPTLDIDETSITLYRDNADYTTNLTTVRGRAWADLSPGATAAADTNHSVLGQFTQLKAGSDGDYEILRDVYGPNFKIIRLVRQMSGEQRLAATYRARTVDATGAGVGDYVQVGSTGEIEDASGVPAVQMKLLRAPTSKLVADAAKLYFETDTTLAPFNPVRELELRNFYQIGGQGIDPVSFSLRIYQGYADPPVYNESGKGIPYLEVMGLDNYDESGGTPVRGAHDGAVDGTVVNSTTLARAFVDYRNGVLFLPDPRPFAPRLGESGRAFDRAVSALLSRRDSLVGAADPHSATSVLEENAANPLIYDGYNPLRSQSSTYFIEMEYKASQVQGEISLGRSNVLENSEVVTVNGEQWVRDKDYTIDYDIGTVTLKRQVPTGAQLNVNYSYAPLFQQAGRTLVGSAFRLEGRDKSLGGAFLYESKGAQDLRPRLGEEPSRSLITDLNTAWTFRPNWMTRLVDRLPGLRTTAASTMAVQAEVGVSLPNPNTRNEVYVDDMEGTRDAVSLSMAQERWSSGSAPLIEVAPGTAWSLAGPEYLAATDTLRNAELRWYSPPGYVEERDLKPNLSDAQGGRNPHQVLSLSVPRRPRSAPGDSTRLWGGVTTLIDQAGLDLSRAQFIELWVNDFNDLHAPGDGLARVRGRHVRLHVDIGSVSEDQMRSPDVTPNALLDTEDRVRDNVLTEDEDTGLDALPDPDAGVVRDLIRAGPADPEGDDFYPPDELVNTDEARSVDPRYWAAVNGTEGNRTNRTTPDTEDLNLNGALDGSNDYIEYTIDLGDVSAEAPYLVTDVQREFGPLSPAPVSTVTADNGWRRYRIPLDDTLAVEFGNPNLALVQHVRVWVQGVVESDSSAADIRLPLLMLGGLDIVGSRWDQTALDSLALAEPLTTVTLNTVNTVDNADVYVAPFDPGETRTGSEAIPRREQSISLEFTDLKPGSTLEAYKTFSLDENYSRYGKLNWFAAAYEVRDEDGRAFDAAVDTALFYFVRFATDETGRNYYEYRSRLPGNSTARSIRWSTVALQLTALSNLKLNPDFPATAPIRYAVAGTSPGESLIVNGSPSFTRLRRISFGLLNLGERRYASGQLWFDELRATDIAKDVDHAQRVQVNGQLADLMSYSLSWSGRGADFLSVGESRGSGTATDQLSWNTSFQTHRFFAQTGISLPLNLSYSRSSSRPRFSAGSDIVRTGAMQDASESRTESRAFSTSYSRTWSERSNPFLRYTLGGITASYSFAESKNRNPSAVDSSVTKAATVNYVIAPRKLLAIPLPLVKGRLHPLPERAYWNYYVSSTRTVSYERLGAELDSLRLSRDVSGRSAGINFGADTRPVDLVQHHIEGRRNLVLPEGRVRNDRIGFINLGRVTDWRQTMNASYSHARGRWLKPSFSWSSSYTQNNGPELSQDLSVRAVSNGQSVEMNLELPFERLFGKAAARPGARPAPGTPPRGTGTPPRGRVVGTTEPGRRGGPPGPAGGAEELEGLGPDERAALEAARDSREGATARPSLPDTTRPAALPDTTRSAAPPDTTRSAALPDTTRSAALPDATRSAALPDTTRSAALPDTTRQVPPADSLRRGTPPDSARGRPPAPAPRRPSWVLPSWRALAGAFGNVTTNAGFSRTSSYSRLTGTPSFAYLFGFSSRLDTVRTRPQYGNSANISTSWHSSARTRVRLPFGSSANTRFELTERVAETNAVRTQSRTVRFPDFDVEYGRLTSVLRLDRFFTSPQLRTTYSRLMVTEYANSHRSPTGRSKSSNWRPLFGLSGSLKGGTRAELKIERRVTETENLLSGHSVTTDRQTTSNFSVSRSYSKGQKVTVLGKAKTMSTTVSLGLTGQYEHQKGETVSYADDTRKHPLSTKYPSETDRLSLNGTGSYSFSNNVTGNVTLGYGQSNNRVTKIKTRNVRLELRAQFTF